MVPVKSECVQEVLQFRRVGTLSIKCGGMSRKVRAIFFSVVKGTLF